jgi:hypothetical protein
MLKKIIAKKVILQQFCIIDLSEFMPKFEHQMHVFEQLAPLWTLNKKKEQRTTDN